MNDQEFQIRRAQIAAEGRYDPLLFAEHAWPWGVEGTNLENKDIRQWQADVFDCIAKHLSNRETRFDPLFIAVGSGHGIGKSAGMGMLSNWAMSCYKDPRINITANTEGQLRTKTSPEIGQWFRTSLFGEDMFEVDTMSIRYRNSPEQHRVDFVPWSETRPESFAGLHAEGRLVMFLMDEASAIPEIIWETAEGALTDENTVMIFIAFGNTTRN
ncbi:MAG: terminase, partial [Octadecabacter sp.]|nr:terminase [Octadecabacter sp.]